MKEIWDYSAADADLQLVASLRQQFLQPHVEGLPDYWKSLQVLAAYHATLGQRILWKWQAVFRSLNVLESLFSDSPQWSILDWGCGSGVASDALMDFLSSQEPLAQTSGQTQLSFTFFDRSKLAVDFCLRKFCARYPNVRVCGAVEQLSMEQTQPCLVLVSHVLTELAASDLEALLALLEKQQAVLWVESGTPFCSKKLVEVRQRFLKAGFVAEKPCPHQGQCGVLQQSGTQHWCHFYAAPDPQVFRDSAWQKISRELGIDLRALPVSFLFLRKPWHSTEPVEVRPQGELVLGRIKEHKGHSVLTVCSANEVADLKVSHKNYKSQLKQLEKSKHLLRYFEF